MKTRMILTLWMIVGLLASMISPLNVKVVQGASFFNYYYVKPMPAGTGDCSSWENACTLDQALAHLYDSTNPADFYYYYIYLTEGIYRPTNRTNPDDPRSATFTIYEGVNSTIYLQGGYANDNSGRYDWRRYKTILSGDLAGDDEGFLNTGENSLHVVTANNTTSNTTLDGLYIRGGNANTDGDDQGGGLLAQGSSLLLYNVVFSENQAVNGGGAYLSSVDLLSPSPKLQNVSFYHNVAWSAGGGLYSVYNLDLNQATFLANRAQGVGGGAFLWAFSVQATSARMMNAVFNANSAGEAGGAIYASGSSFRIYNSTFYNNIASQNPALQSKGGAVAAYNASEVFIYNSLFWGNRAEENPQVYNEPGISPALPSTSYHDHNLIQGSGGSGSLWDSSLGVDSGGNIDPPEPLFADPNGPDGRPGTPDDDLSLDMGSPARDAGTWVNMPADLWSDRVDNPRATSYPIDIGAYEAVETVFIYVNQAATGANDGSSWADAFTSLSEALYYANSIASYYNHVAVWVARGVYRPGPIPNVPDPADLRERTFRLDFYVRLYGGFAGGETRLRDRDWVANPTILDGDQNGDDIGFTNNSENSYHVVEISSTINAVSGFIIRGGNANHPTIDAYRKGGGLYSGVGTPTLTNLLLKENSAVSGGGVAIEFSGGEGYGQEEVSAGDMQTAAEPFYWLGNVTFENNQAYQGGGLWVGNADVFLNRSGFFNNRAAFGGGIYNIGRLGVANAVFTDNAASDSGGAIFHDGNAPFLMINASLARNTSPRGGAGSYQQGAAAIYNSIIWNNHSEAGHAVFINPGLASAKFAASLVQESGGSAAWNPALGTDGGGNIDTDPLFASTDLRLSVVSPAVDKGENTWIGDELRRDYAGLPRILGGVVDMGAYEVFRPNTTWPTAAQVMAAPAPTLAAANSAIDTVTLTQTLNSPGQSRWFKVPIEPDSRLTVTLTNLPANYDLTIYKHIPDAFKQILSSEDLTELDAEFAPDMYSPDMYSPDMYSPDMYSPDMYSPDMYSPDMYSPDMYSPDMYSPVDYLPDATPEEVMQAFSSAQSRSLVGISALEGTASENLAVNTWNNTGSYYIRVNGRNGVYDPARPFRLSITRQTGQCTGLTTDPNLPGLTAQARDYQTLVLTDWARLASQDPASADPAFRAKVNDFAASVGGVVVDVGQDANVAALNAQADGRYTCVYAKNLVAGAIREVVRAYRVANPNLAYLVLIGNDEIIPFFRHPDFALLGSESSYTPPVQNETASQASLKSNYYLSQDDYGASRDLSFKTDVLPIPDLAVGRLVETSAEIATLLDAFAQGGGQLAAPQTALVTGYDFLADAASEVAAELEAGLPAASEVETLISARELAPAESWTADDLRAKLFTTRHDIIYLAGHFSAGSTLAADNATRMTASELDAAGVDLRNALVYSAGCHSGYNLVNEHGFAGISPNPDWAQAFARKGATLVAGTGYQYGDTDFIEYSERLYLLFTRYLRAGSGPVSVGQALVQAKQAYLQETAELRGIHAKALLEATLFGLPMATINFPGERYTPPSRSTIIPAPTGYSTNPGQTLGLRFADVTINTPTTLHTKELRDASQPPQTFNATYLTGDEGQVKVNPFEPALPVMFRNVSDPQSLGVLRGVGFRGGVYSDTTGVLPLTGAAATEIRGVHAPFYTDIFYPIRPFWINYFGDLADPGLQKSALAITPAQYRSSASDSPTGILRTFSEMSFRMFYSGETGQYGDEDNTPANASPPAINRVLSSVEGSEVSFEVEVLGDPSAGIQEVWITYTAESGSLEGVWQSLDLQQFMGDTRLWKGVLALPLDTPASDVRFVVQAVNGVGKVTLSTNWGAYYVPGTDPGARPTAEQRPTTLTLAGAAAGAYGTEVTLTATLSDASGPLDGKLVTFRLGSQQRSAVTGPTSDDPTRPHGQAQVTLLVLGAVGPNQAQATFRGGPDLAYSTAELPFEILKQDTDIVLSELPNGQVEILLRDATGRPLSNQALFVAMPATTLYLLTDFTGRTRFTPTSGAFIVFFNGQIPIPGKAQGLALVDERYNPAVERFGSFIYIPAVYRPGP